MAAFHPRFARRTADEHGTSIRAVHLECRYSGAIHRLGRNQEVVIVKNELPYASFVIECRHFVGDPFRITLAKTPSRGHAVKSGDAAISTTAVATSTPHQVTGGHARDRVDRPAPVGEWQVIEVVQRRALTSETHLLSVPVGNAGDLWETFFQVRHGIGDFNQRPFAFMNHDDVDLGMVGEEWFSGA